MVNPSIRRCECQYRRQRIIGESRTRASGFAPSPIWPAPASHSRSLLVGIFTCITSLRYAIFSGESTLAASGSRAGERHRPWHFGPLISAREFVSVYRSSSRNVGRGRSTSGGRLRRPARAAFERRGVSRQDGLRVCPRRRRGDAPVLECLTTIFDSTG